MNPYLYCRAGPVTLSDPSGLGDWLDELVAPAQLEKIGPSAPAWPPAPLHLGAAPEPESEIGKVVAVDRPAPGKMAALTSTEVLIPGVISIRDENHGERPAEEPAEIAISHPGVASGGSGTSADPKFVEVHGDPVSEFTMQLPFMLWPAGRLVGAEATTGKSLVAAEAKGGIIAGEEALATGKVGVSGGTAVEEIGAVGKAGTELGAAEAGAAPFQGPKSLREMAREIWKLGGGGPANGRTIAVGVAEDGTLHGGSSNWWTKAQRDYTDRMGIKRAMGSDALHAEGEILRGIDRGKIPRIESIGTYPPMPCDKPNFMCAERLEKRGINVVQGTGMGADPLRRSEFG